MRRRTYRLAALIALLGPGLVACRGHGEEEDEEGGAAVPSRVDPAGRVVLTAEERRALDLEVAPAVLGRLTWSSLRFGKVVARPQEDGLVVAPVTGRLGAPATTLGAEVGAGDPLVALAPLLDTASRAGLEAQRRDLQGQLKGAEAHVTSLASELQRVSTLAASHLATEAERARAEADLASEKARVDSLRRAGGELGRVTGGEIALRAPFAGVVAALDSETGALVSQGAVLARVVRAGPRWVDLAVPPGDEAGASYQIRRAQRSDQATPAPVAAVLLNRGAVVEPDGTRRDRLEAAAPAAASLAPGETIAVDVLHQSDGILVPEEALVRRGADQVLFVEVSDGRFEARRVKLGPRGSGGAVITSGISTGERVVVRGAAALLGELGEAGAAVAGAPP